MMRQLLAGLEKNSTDQGASSIVHRIQNHREWHHAKSVLMYSSIQTEIDLTALMHRCLDTEKKLYLPRFNSSEGTYEAAHIQSMQSDLKRGHFDILEPKLSCPTIPISEIDMFLVPGLAFDQKGHRLGRGKGYFDKMLKNTRRVILGIALDEQMVEEVPVEKHDIRMHFVVTPTRWIQCSVVS